ncbi:helix-turn-helix transcriptional regulator [Leuconostoc gelidum subsp. aenigmaticum]|nr:helix-turn-helix transcriptional regulator [Leuconostoc gelidum subsp. aenigmaticum]
MGKKSGSSVANWEKGLAVPNIEILIRLTHIFDVSIDELVKVTLQEESFPSINTLYLKLNRERKQSVYFHAQKELHDQNKAINFSDIVEIYGAVSAGTGEFLSDTEYHESISYSGEIPPHDYAVTVNGNSMEPMFTDKQIIFVNRTQEARNGQIVIAKYDGSSVYVKKLILDEQGCRLVSLNKDYDDLIVDHDHNLEVLGTVVL